MATILSGLDLLVFTGGIGFHDEAMRKLITSRLQWIAPFAVRAMPAQEEQVIIRKTYALTLVLSKQLRDRP
jgi:acetate kinase